MFNKIISIFFFLAVVLISIHGTEQINSNSAPTKAEGVLSKPEDAPSVPNTAPIVPVEKKSNYDQFVRLEKIIYCDISSATTSTNKVAVIAALKKLKTAEASIHREVAAADMSGVVIVKPKGGQAPSPSTSAANDPVKKIKNVQARYSSEIFMFAENYRRAIEAMNEVKFSDDTIDLNVRSMLRDYHMFYQKLLDPGAVNRIPEILSLLRRAKSSEAEARRQITMQN